MKKENRSVCNFLQPNNVLCGLTDTDGKVVLGKLISLLKRHFPALDEEFTGKEIANREALFPTMIAPGLALPHARIPGLTEPLTAVACIPEGCDFGASSKAKVMILLLTPVDNPNLHIQLLSALAQAFTDEAVTDKASKCTNAQDLIALFSADDTRIPDFLKARDLLEPFPAILQETDSILDAIKKFAMTRSEELPVVDDTGDMRGVLAMADLLKYSLPEHLLWLEDMSPIYELQPFSDMLKTADENKVADIMREEFTMAQIDDPAVKLAKIFLQTNLPQLIIVDTDGKPAGMVTLKNFSAKLFWD